MRLSKSSLLLGGTCLFLLACSGEMPGGAESPDLSEKVQPPKEKEEVTLASVQPPLASNAGGTMLTLTGSGFEGHAAVTIGGSAASDVVVVSSTKITAIAPARAATCAAQVVTVTNPDGRSASRSDLFKYITSALGFEAARTTSVTTAPRALVAADINGDDKLDILTANSGDGNAAVRLGVGDGTFTMAANAGAGNSPYALALVDLSAPNMPEGDGKLDLVVVNNNSNNLTIRPGKGDGTFGDATTVTVGAGPYDIATGDLNGDGRKDLIVVNNGSNNVTVRLRQENGTFGAQMLSTVGSQPVAIALGDLNGDRKLDYATANSAADNVSVRLGKGDGTFGMEKTFAAGDRPMDVALHDIDGDGKLDLIVTSANDGTLHVRLGKGDGDFGEDMTYMAGNSPRSIAIADLNGDDLPDVLVSNFQGSSLSAFLGTGGGKLAAAVSIAVSTQPSGVVIGDFNKDGFLDVAATSQNGNSVLVRLGKCM